MVGDLVRKLREERAWSQEELAAKSGISQFAVSRIETGRVVPDLHTWDRIARSFGFMAGDLLPNSFGFATAAREYAPVVKKLSAMDADQRAAALKAIDAVLAMRESAAEDARRHVLDVTKAEESSLESNDFDDFQTIVQSLLTYRRETQGFFVAIVEALLSDLESSDWAGDFPTAWSSRYDIENEENAHWREHLERERQHGVRRIADQFAPLVQRYAEAIGGKDEAVESARKQRAEFFERLLALSSELKDKRVVKAITEAQSEGSSKRPKKE